ncbi:hypothetical protein D932_00434 [Enterococcus casseliflavus 14-MB-W-14]|nr:hypothetical protein D932_00434 [Enterococcus casseliflavus 14-MB-W-14]
MLLSFLFPTLASIIVGQKPRSNNYSVPKKREKAQHKPILAVFPHRNPCF